MVTSLSRCAFVPPVVLPWTRQPLFTRRSIYYQKCQRPICGTASPAAKTKLTRGQDVLLQVIDLVGGIGPSQLEKFYRLTDLLLEATKRVNLTAVRHRDGVLEKHIADSLTLVPAIEEHPELLVGEQDARVIDIGSGGGFPGLVLAIARPEWQLTLVESRGKKVKFHLEVIDLLGLKNTRSFCIRAEMLGRDWKHREKYEFAVARSVADTRRLAELTLPFVKPGGYLLAQKTVDIAQKELDIAKKALKMLGGKIASVRPAWGGVNPLREIAGPSLEGRYKAIVQFEKAHETPGRYPRDAKNIKKRPLGIHK